MNLHINDVFALRMLLDDVYNGRPVNRRHLNVLLEACNEEVEAFNQRMIDAAIAEEEAQQ